MDAKKFKKVTKSYLVIFAIAITIYFCMKTENGTIDVEAERTNLIIIMFFGFIGTVMTGILLSATNTTNDRGKIYDQNA